MGGADRVVTGVWAVIFLTATDATSGGHSLTQTAKLVWRTVNNAIVPALIGGPWIWDRWIPSPPMAAAPIWLIALGWAAVVAAGVFALLGDSAEPRRYSLVPQSMSSGRRCR